MKELDRVVLTRDFPEYHLKKGDLGTIVLVHEGNSGYEIEFMTLDGDTLNVVSLGYCSIHFYFNPVGVTCL